jgi:mutator protein MutT
MGRPANEVKDMEWNDIYDAQRNLTGKRHRRGTRWRKGEYGLVVCVWVYDGHGKVLMTKRAPGKSFAGTWENSGGAAQAGETSLQAIRRELFEETGIQAEESEFELLETGRDDIAFYDYYCLHRQTPIEEVVLLPGETVDAKWVTFSQVHEMIANRQMCYVIARQFRRQEPALLARQNQKE